MLRLKTLFKFFNLSNSKYTTNPITLFPYCYGNTPKAELLPSQSYLFLRFESKFEGT